MLGIRVSSGRAIYPTIERWLVESEGKPLEASLNDVMVLLVEVAVKTRLKEARREVQHRQQRVEWERQEAERRLEQEQLEAERRWHEAEAARTQQLLELSERWAQAEQLRAFIAAVEAGGRVPAAVTEETTLQEWVAWARRQVFDLDPLEEED